MKTTPFTIALISLILLAACSLATPGVATPTTGSPTAANPTALPSLPVGPAPTQPSVTEPAPTATQNPVDPALVQQAVIEYLASSINIPTDQIQIVRVEAVQWQDTCLGLTLPGVKCGKTTLDGFRFLLSANGITYEFHTTRDGHSILPVPQQEVSLRLLVSTADLKVEAHDLTITLGSAYHPAFNGFMPKGGSAAGTAYVLDTISSSALALNEGGSQQLSFIRNPTYGLAVWPGDQGAAPLLAWGSHPDPTEPRWTLQKSAPDGTQVETLLTLTGPVQPVAQLWSADGKSLYFSKEGAGLGGYIPFAGASSLYSLDLANLNVTDLIPFEKGIKTAGCLDALSGDARYVADHCTENIITVRDLTTNEFTTIQPPAGADHYRLMGTARFSPDGLRVAYALAAGDPSSEQGWVAVSDGLSGASKLVLTGQPGSYYNVVGWLNDETLLVQSTTVQCSAEAPCTNQLWTMGIDGSNLNKVGDGSLLAIVDKP